MTPAERKLLLLLAEAELCRMALDRLDTLGLARSRPELGSAEYRAVAARLKALGVEIESARRAIPVPL